MRDPELGNLDRYDAEGLNPCCGEEPQHCTCEQDAGYVAAVGAHGTGCACCDTDDEEVAFLRTLTGVSACSCPRPVLRFARHIPESNSDPFAGIP